MTDAPTADMGEGAGEGEGKREDPSVGPEGTPDAPARALSDAEAHAVQSAVSLLATAIILTLSARDHYSAASGAASAGLASLARATAESWRHSVPDPGLPSGAAAAAPDGCTVDPHPAPLS